MDTIGWLIANLHQMLGHDRTADFLGQDHGDKERCILCRYERGEVTKEQVEQQMGGPK